MFPQTALEEWPEAGLQAWLNAASASVSRDELIKAIQGEDQEGMTLNALYMPEAETRPLRTDSKEKKFPELIQWLWCHEKEGFQTYVKEAISGGADAVEIFGDYPSDAQFFSHLFSGFNPDNTALWLDFGESNSTLPFILLDELSRHLMDPRRLRGGLNYDPFTTLAFTGRHDLSEAETFRTLRAVFNEGGLVLSQFRLVGVNACAFHEAGAFSSLELALALALTDAYREALHAENAPDYINKIHIRLAAGMDFSGTIAKFLAFRVLWDNYSEALRLGFFQQPFTVAVVSRFWYSAFDVHNNLVRQTLQALAAALGGCDALLMEPFDIVRSMPDKKSYRLSRNIALLLKQESDLEECLSLTDGCLLYQQYAARLAEKSWELFIEIQKQGGYLKALYNGWIQRQVQRHLEQHLNQLNKNERTIVGATRYLNQQEKITTLPPLPFRYPLSAKRTDFEILQEKQFLRKLDELRLSRD